MDFLDELTGWFKIFKVGLPKNKKRWCLNSYGSLSEGNKWLEMIIDG